MCNSEILHVRIFPLSGVVLCAEYDGTIEIAVFQLNFRYKATLSWAVRGVPNFSRAIFKRPMLGYMHTLKPQDIYHSKAQGKGYLLAKSIWLMVAYFWFFK